MTVMGFNNLNIGVITHHFRRLLQQLKHDVNANAKVRGENDSNVLRSITNSLFARVIDLDTGESGDMIFNKYDAVCSDLDDPEEPELLPEELELLKKLDAEEE